MEAILTAQDKHRVVHGLQKVKAVRNKNYQRHGTKSYVYLLNRFGFQPTKPGNSSPAVPQCIRRYS